MTSPVESILRWALHPEGPPPAVEGGVAGGELRSPSASLKSALIRFCQVASAQTRLGSQHLAPGEIDPRLLLLAAAIGVKQRKLQSRLLQHVTRVEIIDEHGGFQNCAQELSARHVLVSAATKYCGADEAKSLTKKSPLTSALRYPFPGDESDATDCLHLFLASRPERLVFERTFAEPSACQHTRRWRGRILAQFARNSPDEREFVIGVYAAIFRQHLKQAYWQVRAAREVVRQCRERSRLALRDQNLVERAISVAEFWQGLAILQRDYRELLSQRSITADQYKVSIGDDDRDNRDCVNSWQFKSQTIELVDMNRRIPRSQTEVLT